MYALMQFSSFGTSLWEPAMADDRTTSEAKNVELDSYLNNTLDEIESPQEAFEMAADGPPQPDQERDGGDVRESDMVSGDAAQNNMQPPPEMAGQVDRATHQAEMRTDHDGAMEHNDEQRDLNEQLESGLENELDGGPDAGGKSWSEWEESRDDDFEADPYVQQNLEEIEGEYKSDPGMENTNDNTLDYDRN